MATKSGVLRRLLYASLGLLAAVAALFVFAVVMAMNASNVANLAATVERAAPWFLAWRISLCTAIVAAWPWLVDRLRPGIPAESRAVLRTLRWRVALWLVAIELVLVQGFPMRFLVAALS